MGCPEQSAAHGTWLDGKRLPSMTPTLMKDTATFQLGTSKRVYRIDWQPAPEAGQHAGSSDLSSSSTDAARELSPPSESTSVFSGLRYSADNQVSYSPNLSRLQVNCSVDFCTSTFVSSFAVLFFMESKRHSFSHHV